jgi:hypothetical protein
MFIVLLNEILDAFSRTKMLKSHFLCSSIAQGKELLFIKKLSVKDHVIFYCEGSHQGKIFRMGMLMGEGPPEIPRLLPEARGMGSSCTLALGG